ncbi:sigma 54-interacting transcriptional regulator [Alteromonadaceae bacterium BrNp21-10]|nr:sigma 54-interacting transcriptional regulator [Alteromonadaceae bacterium BrNp21-10]
MTVSLVNNHVAALAIYVEPGCEDAFLTLQKTLTLSHPTLGLHQLDSPSQSATRPLLIICQNADSALALTTQFSLRNDLIYWLPVDTKTTKQNSDMSGQWLEHWQQPNNMTALWPLLIANTTLAEELKRHQQKLSLLSDCLGDLTLTLSQDGRILEVNSALADLTDQSATELYGQHWLDIFSIPSSAAQKRMHSIFTDIGTSKSITRLPTFPIQYNGMVRMMDGFIAPSAPNETMLVLRQVANWQAQNWGEQQKQQGSPVTLLLINPDNLTDINQQHGREQGDMVLKDIMQILAGLLRDNDFATRYSGAVFAAHLPDTNAEQGQKLAARLHQILSDKGYAEQKLSLTFSVGLSTLEGQEQLGEQSPLELFRRANAALQAAKNIGGGKLVIWRPQFDDNVLANLDRMSGKFSSDPNDDFRLMMLQWDIIRLMGQTHSLSTFAEQTCQLLSPGLQCHFAGMLLLNDNQLTAIGQHAQSALTAVQIDSLLQWAQQQLKPLLSSKDPHHCYQQNISEQACALIPLITRDQCRGLLLVSWPQTEQRLADKCTTQLQQISPNLAATLDRILLVEQEKRRQTLTHEGQPAKQQLLFESAAMRTLMQQVQLVGPTDATVLVIGESGTGKELIAQQIHNNSLRPDKPFVTVDCSTIVEHLIESELFGHRRGAFTGATHDQPGRIAQADGGTLFLDEVGELPLDIQSKLLRFVQEKTYIAVGDQRVRKVDVRLILATNRNLPAEVTAGRFRGDLYYRINVFTLHLPTLHERGNDAVVLARHFLQQFSQQYNKTIIGLSDEASQKISAYYWPGNVRELQNSLMRAVILCQGHYLEAQHLILQEQGQPPAPPVSQLKIDSISQRSEAPSDQQLTQVLEKAVAVAMQEQPFTAIGDWLEKQWLSQCLTKWCSIYQVAQQLEQSESTLRRRYAKLDALTFDNDKWQTLSSECAEIIDILLEAESAVSRWGLIKQTLLSIVLEQDLSQQQRAKLLNVTQPTLRKMMQQHPKSQ